MVVFILIVLSYIMGIGTHCIYKCDNQYRMLKRIDAFYKSGGVK